MVATTHCHPVEILKDSPRRHVPLWPTSSNLNFGCGLSLIGAPTVGTLCAIVCAVIDDGHLTVLNTLVLKDFLLVIDAPVSNVRACSGLFAAPF